MKAMDIFEIRPVREHFEVYLDGQFICSADTEAEAEKEIDTYCEALEFVEALV
jgi:hypothetical protein